MSGKDVQLAWALVAGELTHISEFGDAPIGSRPAATCALCRGILTMKLGPKRAHHFSHRPGDDCSLRNPETARHFNTKHLLASKLRAADALSVVTKCAWSSAHVHCTNDLTSVAAEGWDEVRVEPFIDPLRPDILLAKAGAAKLAIEVRATHAVPNTKAVRLADLGIPWVEVDASGEWDEWEPTTSMPAIRHESELAPTFCSTHSQPSRARPASPPIARQGTASGASTYTDSDGHGERWRFRVVDCYPVRGPRVRKVFSVYRMDLNSRAIRLRLADDDRVNSEDTVDSFIIAEVRASESSNESLRKLNDRLREYLKRSCERFDSPRRWLDSREFPENPAKLYGEAFMSVKYRRDSNGGWTTSPSGADI